MEWLMVRKKCPKNDGTLKALDESFPCLSLRGSLTEVFLRICNKKHFWFVFLVVIVNWIGTDCFGVVCKTKQTIGLNSGKRDTHSHYHWQWTGLWSICCCSAGFWRCIFHCHYLLYWFVWFDWCVRIVIKITLQHHNCFLSFYYYFFFLISQYIMCTKQIWQCPFFPILWNPAIQVM